MTDVHQPIVLAQEPPRGADAIVRAHGGTLECRGIDDTLRWVLVLPPGCTVTEHQRYRSVVQYRVRLSATCVFTLCCNTHPTTGEESYVIVIPGGSA